jgi:uracil-DNA glycosylase
MLNELYEEYEREPGLVTLRKPGIKLVKGRGPSNPDIMLVGEAPGALENASGEPFIGKAGKLLDQLLEKIGRIRDEIYITNAVKYWPLDENNSTRHPSPIELGISKYYLLREIDIIKPRLVGLCGHSAITCLFPHVRSVSEVHAQLIAERYVPLYHPAQMGYKPLMSGKMLKGYKMLNEYLLQQKDNAE